MSIKNKAISSFGWILTEGLFSQGFLFMVGIILARLLTPVDFGVIGIITAIIAISNSVVEGGFGSALIRKVDADTIDYNTIFYSNLTIAIIIYFFLLIGATTLAGYFDVAVLSKIIPFAGILLIINSFSIVQRAILTKVLNFKTQALISIIASFGSGLTAIIMAYQNFGIWSLVTLAILRPLLNSILLWYHSKWRPSLIFSIKSFKELFNYGYKLLITNLIHSFYRNIYYVLIGKYFNTQTLGYYTRAEQFQAPFSSNITTAIQRLSFPILSKVQNDHELLKSRFIKFLRFSMFLNFTVMFVIAAIAEPMVILLVGEKWRASILYLQLLCVPGILYPLQILHLNLLLVKGYSNLNLKLELIKKMILIPLVLGTALLGIEALLAGIVIFAFIEFFINNHYTKTIINYSLKEQLKDIIPFILLGIALFIIMYTITFIDMGYLAMVIIQLTIGITFFISTNEFIKLPEYLEIKDKIIEFFYKARKHEK
ncbi:Membrane protein involved in the export of O-antigen and teichoic acid [Maribacter sedimenticola]|uniref:Membrane protein involved in the export of O-antigen and teichoic acid n=1 Tax=Maribacter sedimenticola TaxID=228956 RepID=A0ABY1SJV8_9FLAO|nr:lipopolysaccharide biosynthesis protein [Maribacter sedimenticola]SNR66825.1 Membrane protein involved in the export of O-antigen and teichoic acid [Maribacter sedimenticola]